MSKEQDSLICGFLYAVVSARVKWELWEVKELRLIKTSFITLRSFTSQREYCRKHAAELFRKNLELFFLMELVQSRIGQGRILKTVSSYYQ